MTYDINNFINICRNKTYTKKKTTTVTFSIEIEHQKAQNNEKIKKALAKIQNQFSPHLHTKNHGKLTGKKSCNINQKIKT